MLCFPVFMIYPILVIVIVFSPLTLIWGSVNLLWKLHKLVQWFTAKRNRNLNKYGAYSGNSWAVITGASSGIGEQMVYVMCKSGFDLVIIARREECLKRVKQYCYTLNSNCKVKIVLADLSRAFDTHNSLLGEIYGAVGDQGEIRILMHFAGNSDLAVHLTDKSIERNISVMRLVVESTLVLVQMFTEQMCLKSKGRRCAIMTCGALTAYTPAPTFAASSANKHYVRALTTALAAEYEYIDFMVAHPIAVRSEILKQVDGNSGGDNIGGMIIDSDVFVKNIVAEMGHAVDLNGHWKHDILVYLLNDVLPLSWVHQFFYKQRASDNSKFLGRPIDSRDILEKF